MRQSTLKKVQIDHALDLHVVATLPTLLENHPLAMESITRSQCLVVVTEATDAEGREVVVAPHLDKEARDIQVNEVASMYGKRDLACSYKTR